MKRLTAQFAFLILRCTVVAVKIIIYMVDTARRRVESEKKTVGMQTKRDFYQINKMERNKNNANAINAISIGTFPSVVGLLLLPLSVTSACANVLRRTRNSELIRRRRWLMQ